MIFLGKIAYCLPICSNHVISISHVLKSSQDEFQRKIDECFDDLPGLVAIVDDVLIYGKTKAEHDAHLRVALERCREKGIKLNSERLAVGQTEVDYFGHNGRSKTTPQEG
jgi:hypothetical protein